jgi:hypothetical protein
VGHFKTPIKTNPAIIRFKATKIIKASPII